MDDLQQQIALEQAQIEIAPKVPVTQPKSGLQGRCGWCGRLSDDLVYVETVHGVERYKGRACCGGRHG